MINVVLLQEYLQWFVAVGAGLLAYWLVGRPVMCKLLRKLAKLTEPNLGVNLSFLKRLTAMALSTLLALAGYLIQGALGWAVLPVGTAEWLALVLSLSGVSYPIGQLLHGARELGKK
jgi:hypothetical protein